MTKVYAPRFKTLMTTASISVLATFASAQSNTMVSIEIDDSGSTVSGELMGFENNRYRLKTTIGELLIPADNALCTGNACPTLAPGFVRGGDVVLTSKDGSFSIIGAIEAIENGNYVVLTDTLGQIKVDMAKVNCSGDGCPTDNVLQAAPAVAAPDDAKVRFAGSDTIGLGLLPYLAEDYADFLGARVETTALSETETYRRYVDASGNEVTSLFASSTRSDDATDALEAGGAEFGMMSRPMQDSEAERLLAAGLGDPRGTPDETVIAVDSVAVITHPDNPVRELDINEIEAIYLGQITNWSAVGGPDAPITVLSHEDGSSTRSVFERAIFSGEEPSLAARVTYPGADNPKMAEAVRNDPNAIGYVGFAYSEGLNRLDLTSSCGITSTADTFSVKTEEYPLGRRLYLYNSTEAMAPDARRFLDYALSPEADDAIEQSNFVNFAVERTAQPRSRYASLYRDLTDQSEIQLANEMRRDLDQWDRLSTTVRFPTGSTTLGGKELNDIERLVSYLEDLPEGTRIAIVGFADSVGPFEANLRLSDRRALAVAQTIDRVGGSRLSGIEFERRSYGELAPSVCDTDANGRTINRRVELWIHKNQES